MTRECYYCGSWIDTEHDEHYYCKCRSAYKAVCTQDHMKHPECPDCGNPLRFRDSSYQKKLFKSPSARGLLGF